MANKARIRPYQSAVNSGRAAVSSISAIGLRQESAACSQALTSNDSHKVAELPQKRKVILLKPLQETLEFSPNNGLAPLAILRSDSDSSDGGSALSFSPTSVLPQRQEAGTLSKALHKQAHSAAAGDASAPPQQASVAHLGSWASRQLTHDVAGRHGTAPPLPGASIDTTLPITIPQQLKVKPVAAAAAATAAPANKRSTLDAAWRWKFKRQWGREQLRSHLQYQNDDDDTYSDPWHDALHMIQAANSNPEACVPVSDHDCYADASPSPLLDASDQDMFGLLEMDNSADSARRQIDSLRRTSSTQALAAAAAKARELRQHQVKVQQLNEQAFANVPWDQQQLAFRKHQPF